MSFVRVADLLKKEPEKKKKEAEEKAERRRLLLEGPRHQFNDRDYIEQLEATQDNFEDALKQGLMAGDGSSSSSSVGKRKAENPGKGSSKRAKLWYVYVTD